MAIQSYNYLNHCSQYEHLCELLQCKNKQLENLIQIYKQFTKLNSSHQGHIKLNMKLCLIESLKCYVEHLILFDKFELLMPPEHDAVKKSAENNVINKS